MAFSYEEKVIIKYLWIKYKFCASRIVNDHPEYKWKVNGVKKLLKNIDETSDVALKEGSRRTKSEHTEENVKLVKEIILSHEDPPGTHSTSAEIARELNIDRRSVPRIMDQDFHLRPLEETQGAKTY